MTIIELFNEVTYIASQDELDRLATILIPHIERGYLPRIDRDEQLGLWVWHSLECPDGTTSLKPAALIYAAQENGLPYHDIEELCVALAALRKDMRTRWDAHCNQNWGPVEWVNRAINSINQTMFAFDASELAVVA